MFLGLFNHLIVLKNTKVLLLFNMTSSSKQSSTKPNFKLAIFALIVPGALFAFSLLMLLFINLIFNPTFWMTGDTEPVNPTPVAITVLNVIFAVTGAVGLISWLPATITGIYLLTKSKFRKTP